MGDDTYTTVTIKCKKGQKKETTALPTVNITYQSFSQNIHIMACVTSKSQAC